MCMRGAGEVQRCSELQEMCSEVQRCRRRAGDVQRCSRGAEVQEMCRAGAVRCPWPVSSSESSEQDMEGQVTVGLQIDESSDMARMVTGTGW